VSLLDIAPTDGGFLLNSAQLSDWAEEKSVRRRRRGTVETRASRRTWLEKMERRVSLCFESGCQ